MLLPEAGWGQVYRATDTKLKRQVAIKVLMAAWSRVAPIVFVPRTTQRGSLAITHDQESANGATLCWRARSTL